MRPVLCETSVDRFHGTSDEVPFDSVLESLRIYAKGLIDSVDGAVNIVV